MTEPLKGGQQFFSNYLSRFADIVESLEKLKTTVEKTIPKYSVASDTIKTSKTFDKTISYTARVDEGDIFATINSQLNGSFKIKMKARADGVNGVIAKAYVNGIDISESTALVNSTSAFGDVTIDVNVVENDVVVLKFYKSGTTAKCYIDKLDICYDLIDKPDLII